MSTLYYLSGFNNYFNRQVKQPTSTLISDYNDYIVLQASEVNFNPNDDVITSVTVNYRNVLRPANNISDDVELDYCLVSDDNVNVSSKWFVIDRKRELGGQFTCSLRRDLFSDYYNAILRSPCYIQKAIVPTTNNLILNSENMNFNQIKTNEYPLMDATQTPWIVGYVARNTSETTITGNAYAKLEDASYDFEYSYQSLLNMGKIYGNLVGDSWGDVIVNVYQTTGSSTYKGTALHSNGYTNPAYGNIDDNNIYISGSAYTIPGYISQSSAVFKAYWDNNVSTINNLFPSEMDFVIQQGKIDNLLLMNNKTIKDTLTGILFTINVKTETETVGKKINASGALYSDIINNAVRNMPGVTVNQTLNNQSVIVNGRFTTATVEVKTIPGKNITTTLPATDTRINLIDQPWDMFAIPYNADVSIINQGVTYKTESNIAVSIAQEMTLDAGIKIYDVQLLPYCPCWNYIDVNGNIRVTEFTENTHYSWVTDSDGKRLSILLWCSTASFNPIIPFTADSQMVTSPSISPVEFKVNNECDMYRLVSPNYSGAFEFSATANGGITGFEANCTYKPFQPYIHINPIFGRLYGRDFNDNRGLICGGNFSMPTTQNEWTNYQIQHKAYNESHLRQIENMEETYNIQRNQQVFASVVQGITGAFGGAGAGGMAGGMGGSLRGMGIGSAIGGVLGAGANIAGAIADLHYADQLFEENKAYAKDQFNLSLQNIQALPNTLSNVGAFDINYKYFPFLEYYTCTDEEKEALREKIKYSGMTVNAIGTIDNYIGATVDEQFVQGQLIRLLDTDADYHIAAEIAQEINKGVYI